MIDAFGTRPGSFPQAWCIESCRDLAKGKLTAADCWSGACERASHWSSLVRARPRHTSTFQKPSAKQSAVSFPPSFQELDCWNGQLLADQGLAYRDMQAVVASPASGRSEACERRLVRRLSGYTLQQFRTSTQDQLPVQKLSIYPTDLLDAVSQLPRLK